MTNEWKQAYREGFSDGYAAAKKEMNYTNYPPVYYGGVAKASGPNISSSGTVSIDPRASIMGTPTPGYAINKAGPDHKMEYQGRMPFASAFTVLGDDC